MVQQLVDPINHVTSKTCQWLGLGRGGGNTNESSPLVERSADQEEAGAPPEDAAPSLSQEYHPFQRSKRALVLCALHTVIFYLVAVVAYSYGFEHWTIVDSLYFATVTFCTIGYGDLSPSTDPGRLFTIFYALYGIGILGAFLSIIGEVVMDAGERAMAKTEARAKQRVLKMFHASTDGEGEQDESKGVKFCQEVTLALVRDFPIILLLFGLAILLGIPEGRSVISSVYFGVITATTIGFGDFHPTSEIMRALCVLYLPFAVCVFGQVLTRIASVYMNMHAQAADEAFLRRELALRDLEAMDADGDGKVTYGEFLSFILIAMDKVDEDDLKEIHSYFKSLDIDNNGFLDKADLVKLSTDDSSIQLDPRVRRMSESVAAAAANR